jgi:hypothetical protein
MLGGVAILLVLTACAQTVEPLTNESVIDDDKWVDTPKIEDVQRIFVGTPTMKSPTALKLETIVDPAGYGCIRLKTECLEGNTTDCSKVGVPANFTVESVSGEFINTTLNISARKVERIVLNVTAEAAPFCNATTWQHLDDRRVLMHKQPDPNEVPEEPVDLPEPIFTADPYDSNASTANESDSTLGNSTEENVTEG